MDYNKLSLVELKNLCKSRNLQFSGTKKQLIKRIVDYEKPEPVVVNDNKNVNLGKNHYIVGVKMEDQSKLEQMGRQVEKGAASLLYYSMNVFYYRVNKNL